MKTFRHIEWLFAAAALVPGVASAAGDYMRYVNLRHVTGIYPESPLVQGADGQMYGTTTQGGHQHGAVYRVNGRHDVDVVHAFAKDSSEGAHPTPLTLGSDGALYGATQSTYPHGGLVFRVSSTGEFQGVCTLPASMGDPSGQLVRDDAGNLYASLLSAGLQGSIGRIAPDCAVTILHKFQGGADGSYAIGGLTRGPDGRLYGTTRDGGSTNSGTAFSVGMDGSGYAVLHDLDANADGCGVTSPLAVGADGALYAGTSNCGPSQQGTIFRLSTAGAFSVIYAFRNHDPLGGYSDGGVSVGPDGTLYGVTSDGGAKGGGTVFTMGADGTGTLLHSFRDYPSNTDGSRPYAAPTALANGELWGTTFAGGYYDLGTIYNFGVGR